MHPRYIPSDPLTIGDFRPSDVAIAFWMSSHCPVPVFERRSSSWNVCMTQTNTSSPSILHGCRTGMSVALPPWLSALVFARSTRRKSKVSLPATPAASLVMLLFAVELPPYRM